MTRVYRVLAIHIVSRTLLLIRIGVAVKIVFDIMRDNRGKMHG